jgi:hypothetical protein
MLRGQNFEFLNVEAGGIITVFPWVHTQHYAAVSFNRSQRTVQLMIYFLLCSREPICTNGIQNCIGTAALKFQLQSCVQDTHTNTDNQEGLDYDSGWRVLAWPWAQSQAVTQQ